MTAGAPAGPGAAERLRSLSARELEALYADLHRRVFECYEDGELAADSGRMDRATATARAQARAGPLIEQARAVHAERVARLRRRARRWWIATVAVATGGSGALLWLLARSG
ncbi:hypothetical protein QFW77_17175 [Luteimonas sp. RD2P54]|uniref:DUF883 domain-containing protein n=1 Tax=Luteimonas endophytica TaxID=3042023 RepID=A0ABT6JDP6_9GAMM|nr:hypothetical protein [Luteimonas endophytica]MDH5824705.1 hypothetical protein [Luteimonas endophytica]